MKEKKYYRINNNGAGNCGYLAYAISLMYALRYKNDSEMTESIFKKLALNKQDSQYLIDLIQKSQSGNRCFSNMELQHIQKKLGPKVRAYAAEQEIDEYKKYYKENHAKPGYNPSNSPSQIFAVVNYEMLKSFKQAFANNKEGFSDNDLEKYEPSKRTSDFVKAEIYKIDLRTQVANFFNQKCQEFQSLFKGLTTENDTKLEKINTFESLVARYTDAFLNKTEILDKYKRHLKSNGEWASEATLINLHRSIQNEHRHNHPTRVDKDGDPVIIWTRDYKLGFAFANNGAKYTHDKDEESLMILNNELGIHWTTIIPAQIIKDVPDKNRPQPLKLREHLNSVSKHKNASTAPLLLYKNRLNQTECNITANQNQVENYFAKFPEKTILDTSAGKELYSLLKRQRDLLNEKMSYEHIIKEQQKIAREPVNRKPIHKSTSLFTNNETDGYASTQSGTSGYMILNMFFSAAKNIALLAIVILVGIGAVSLALTAGVVGLPAAAALGVAASAVTGATFFSIFKGSQDKTNYSEYATIT